MKKTLILILFLISSLIFSCSQLFAQDQKPVSVMLTSYSTTLLANGKDHTRLRIAVTDRTEHEIISAVNEIRIYVTGDGKVTTADGKEMVLQTDTAAKNYAECQLVNGTCNLLFYAGTKPDKVKVEARSEKLWPGSHEIHTLPAGFAMMKPKHGQLPPTSKAIDRMIGADISFVPQIEAKGGKFFDGDKEKDAVTLLSDHGFDIIGLSYYPRWHGTLDDLKGNLADLRKRYNKPLNVVEYSDFKREVHDAVFGLPDEMGKGACIWEPLNWRSGLFDRKGSATELIRVYDQLNKEYLNAK